MVVTVAGRTDRGVHAWGQVMHADLDPDIGPLDAVVRSLNSSLGPEIVVREAQWVDDDFDARFSALDRRYRYRLHVDGAVAPWDAPYVWSPGWTIRGAAMEATAAQLVGVHDFGSFCRRPGALRDGGARSLVRRVLDASWSRSGREWHFDVRAEAFCQQMVRSMVGLCVAAGAGRHDPARTGDVLAARDRGAVPVVAPPSGLTLIEVRYPDSYVWSSGLAEPLRPQ